MNLILFWGPVRILPDAMLVGFRIRKNASSELFILPHPEKSGSSYVIHVESLFFSKAGKKKTTMYTKQIMQKYHTSKHLHKKFRVV